MATSKPAIAGRMRAALRQEGANSIVTNEKKGQNYPSVFLRLNRPDPFSSSETMVQEGMITMEHVMILFYRHGAP